MGFENSGRRPQPTAVKVLRGNPGKQRLNVNEPKPPEKPVECPEVISAAGRVVWDRLAPLCLEMGTLTSVDVDAFVGLCELIVTREEASRQKDAEGFAMFTLSHDFDGAPKIGVHAAIKVERDTANALRPYFEFFGLTPSGRARMAVPKKAEPAPPKWAGAIK